MGHGLELRVLGSVEVLRDGQPVAIGGPKPRLVLAMLLAHRGSMVSTDRLCEELWGDDQPADPGAVLQSHVSRLRAVLRPEVEIVGRAPGYSLKISEDQVDADRFESFAAQASALDDPSATIRVLDAALACFHGSPFEEFADRDWAHREAVRLDELRSKVREDRVDALLGHGDHAAVIPELEAIVAEHPLRERPWQQLVLALYRAGRAVDALRRLSAFRTLMRDELGLDLSPAMRELETRVLTDDPTLAAAARPMRSTVQRPPASATPLVGREAELDRLAAQVRAHRLVTLTGPGGVGKTRMALSLAAALWENFGANVFVVELAPVQDPASTVAAIATAIEVQQRQHLSVEETLFEYLHGRRTLLVVDNCEHLRTTVARLVDRLLAECPEATVLATSREVLGLPGEHVMRVEPLAVADVDADVEEALDAPAVQLFVARAAAAREGFTLNPENVHAIAEIVRRVDGLPLALELAAARLRVMSPALLAERLDTRLDLLAGAQTAMIARHRTLHDLVAWSHDLLDAEEQRLFARLCVFAGGFGLDAAEAVCAGEGLDASQVQLLLANLVDKSIVQLADADLPTYRLLETLREFGLARLAPMERAAVCERHARWYLESAETSARALTTSAEARTVALLDRDFDNLRAAHLWSIEHDDIDVSVRLVAALREYSFRRMRAEVVNWAEETIALVGSDTHSRIPIVLAVAGYGLFVRGDLDGAIDLAHRALRAAQETDTDTSGLAERTLGNALFYRGEVAAATQWMDRMVAAAREGSSARLAHALYMRSVAYTSVGDSVRGAQLAGEARAAARASASPTAHAQAAYALGLSLESTDPDEAEGQLRRTVELAQEAGNRWIQAFALTEVLWLDARRGRPREALMGFADVIDLWYRGGDWANQWLSLRHVFGILVQVADHQGAATLYGALSAVGAAYALPFEAADAARISHLVDDLRDTLHAAAFAAAVRRGASMNDGDIIEFVRDRIRVLAVSGP